MSFIEFAFLMFLMLMFLYALVGCLSVCHIKEHYVYKCCVYTGMWLKLSFSVLPVYLDSRLFLAWSAGNDPACGLKKSVGVRMHSF